MMTVHHDLAPDLPRAEAKLALLVVQCLETALPLGGEIVIQGATSWSFQATGPRLTPDSALWEAIASPSPPPDLAAAHVQFALVGPAAAQAGRALQMTLEDSTLSVTF